MQNLKLLTIKKMLRPTLMVVMLLISHSLLFSFSTGETTAASASVTPISTSALEKEAAKLSDDVQLRQEYLFSLESRLQRSRENLLDVYAQFEAANVKYDKKVKDRNNQLREIYEGKSISFFDILFNSSTLSELFENLKYLSSINAYNAKSVQELKVQRRHLLDLQDQVQVQKQDEFIMVEVQRSELNALASALQQKESLLARLRDDERKRLEVRSQKKANSKYSKYALPLGASADLINVNIDAYPNPAKTTANMPKEYKATGSITEGVSSWYGDAFHGMRTANGEAYNMNDFTAASRTLPFNTFLAVTYKGKTVVVRINDRGPYIPPRVLDLSKAAAKALGLGLGTVKMEIITPIGEGTVISPTVAPPAASALLPASSDARVDSLKIASSEARGN